jgi:hypothetical protein
MKNIFLSLMLIVSAAPLLYAEECFSSASQKDIYEQSLAPAQENAQITACLQNNLNSGDFKVFDSALSSLRKSDNLAALLPQIIKIFRQSQNPQAVFAAAASLISVSGQLPPYQKQLLDVLSSPSGAQDYKKTLAVIILIAMNALPQEYSLFLTPGIGAKDPLLQAYSAAAYTLIVPDAGGKYLDKIIDLYSFDRTFANAAFEATGLKNKVLHNALKAALKNPAAITRLSATEWIADLGDKKLLNALLDSNYSPKDAAELSLAADALARNFAAAEDSLKKTFSKQPSSQQATIAVMVYAFIGSPAYGQIEKFLTSGGKNEVSNALRAISSVAVILTQNKIYYKNPGLEEQKIKKFIPICAHIAETSKHAQVKEYADTAVKELYKLLNK